MIKTLSITSFIFVLITSLFSFQAEAKTKHSKASHTKMAAKKHALTKKVTGSAENEQLGTSFAFDAASVRGKYQIAGQGIASVEDEKVMDDLLGLRRQFKDREIQEDSRK